MVRVFISYHESSQNFYDKMITELEKNKIKYKINRSIFSSEFAAVANAIEESDFIILCINKKYSEDRDCKDEAYYAKDCKKRIIPLIMENGYEPSGG